MTQYRLAATEGAGLMPVISDTDITNYFDLVSEIERLHAVGSNEALGDALQEMLDLCAEYGLRADGSQHAIFLAAEDGRG